MGRSEGCSLDELVEKDRQFILYPWERTPEVGDVS